MHQRDPTLADWDAAEKIREEGHIILDGSSLCIGTISAVARDGVTAFIDEATSFNRMNESVQFVKEQLAKNASIYGITTGFGGSADTRTRHYEALQRALLQHQQCGVLSQFPGIGGQSGLDDYSDGPHSLNSSVIAQSSKSMPEGWVKAAMLVRCNSLLRGHSGVRPILAETLVEMINRDAVPVVPLRGSISASGDLSPLSYVAGALEGNPDIYMSINDDIGKRKIMSADQALARLDLEPIVFGPKEGLGLMNGTAFSTAVGAIVHQESQQLFVLAQALTAMGVEALLGTQGSFDPFIGSVRPHEGQNEAARNINAFLAESSLARDGPHSKSCGTEKLLLRQDRYSIRTASQWIGPCLEDLRTAHKQITVECNSTTDNPLVDVEAGQIHHGGNFQALAITSAMEKTRSSIQLIGRMLFSQCTEVLNPMLNNGLPPSLAADEPSLSYTLKGLDISMAAYQSELGFLANGVASHVQTAEMGNQAINSLALISARYTSEAADLLAMMSAAYLYALCQAVDLRAMHANWADRVSQEIPSIVSQSFSGDKLSSAACTSLAECVYEHTMRDMVVTTTMDSEPRMLHIAQGTRQYVASFAAASTAGKSISISSSDVDRFVFRLADRLTVTFHENRAAFFDNPDARPLLGAGSLALYTFVRQTLGVPFHRGLEDHPLPRDDPATSLTNGETKHRQKATIGTRVSAIYAAIKDNRLYAPVMDCLRRSGQAKV
ncbi:MAG: hypothetical protein M1825_006045 [Sarcosagium campestre]|nr:MAG: hypothetical protein M1825_006045 [Sarcosagium campestre]